MKVIINHTIGMLIASSVFAFAAGAAVAQDPTQVDAKHYKVTFENDQVRILRITYGPGLYAWSRSKRLGRVASVQLPSRTRKLRDYFAGVPKLGSKPFALVALGIDHHAICTTTSSIDGTLSCAWRLAIWSLVDGRRPPDMSNFCCLPGRAGGTPILV